MAKHLSETYSRAGVLSRNGTYRADARGRLKGTGVYDDEAQIETGLNLHVAPQIAAGRDGKVLGKTVKERIPYFKFDYTKPLDSQNFTVAHLPYNNQAHHILPTEVFYDKKWTARHLKVVLTAKYNINEPENIVYLPQCEGRTWIAHVHSLPDHSRGHNKYNERVVDEADPIFDMVEEALDEKDCEKRKDLRKQIYDKLKEIETSNRENLDALGPRPLK